MGRRVRTLGLQLRHWQQLSKPALVALSHLKVDNCAVPDMEQPPQVRYKKIGDALKRSGRKIVLNMCEWGLSKCCSSLRVFVPSLKAAAADNPAEWGPWAGATSWRVSGDIKWGQYLLRQTFLLILSPFRLTDFFDGAGTGISSRACSGR